MLGNFTSFFMICGARRARRILGFTPTLDFFLSFDDFCFTINVCVFLYYKYVGLQSEWHTVCILSLYSVGTRGIFFI